MEAEKTMKNLKRQQQKSESMIYRLGTVSKRHVALPCATRTRHHPLAKNPLFLLVEVTDR
jgi:hypothetical protein